MRNIQTLLFLLVTFFATAQVKVKTQYIIAGQDSLGILPSVRLNSAETSVRLDGIIKDYFFDLEGASFDDYLTEISNKEETPFYPQSDISFETVFNRDSIVSFKISALGCGAYCEDYYRFLSIDLRKGRIILLKELFNEEGKARLIKELNYFKKKTIKKRLKQLKSQKFENRKGRGHVAEEITLLENCNAELSGLDYLEFVVVQDSIWIQMDRCSNHADRSLDGLSYFNYKESIEYYSEFFTEEGWNVFYPNESFEEFSFRNMILKFLFGVVLILIIGVRFIFWARKRVKEIDQKPIK